MHCRLTFDISWTNLLWATLGPTAEKDCARQIVADFEHRLPEHSIVIGLSVRTLYDAVLAETHAVAGDPVLMSGINIEDMFKLTRLHGLVPHAVDISAQTLQPAGEDILEAQEKTGARLCVIAQLFGTVGPIARLAELRSRGVLVIQDMAQSFSAQIVDHLPDADITLFSFGPIKRRTALGGAIAVFKDKALADRVRARIETYPQLSGQWFRRRARKYIGLKALSHPALYAGLYALITHLGRDPDREIGQSARGFSGGDLLSNIRKRPPVQLVQLMTRQVGDDRACLARQRICEAFLEALPESVRLGAHAERNTYWLMPLCVKAPDALIDRLRHGGFDATRGTTSLRVWAADQTVIASAILDHIVYVPHPADMGTKSRSRLLALIIGHLNDKAS